MLVSCMRGVPLAPQASRDARAVGGGRAPRLRAVLAGVCIIAQASRARAAAAGGQEAARMEAPLKVEGAGVPEVVGTYEARRPDQVPEGFARTCREMGWDVQQTWAKLAMKDVPWYESENGSYVYLHVERQWWIDAPSGAGVYIADDVDGRVPQQGWQMLRGARPPPPTVTVLRQ